jgi:hypothetical protein
MQLKKHIRKASRACRIANCEAALQYNPQDQAASDLLAKLQQTKKIK